MNLRRTKIREALLKEASESRLSASLQEKLAEIESMKLNPYGAFDARLKAAQVVRSILLRPNRYFLIHLPRVHVIRLCLRMDLISGDAPTSPAAINLARHVGDCPTLRPQILKALFEIILFEDYGNQWSLSRPMLNLILINEQVLPMQSSLLKKGKECQESLFPSQNL